MKTDGPREAGLALALLATSCLIIAALAALPVQAQTYAVRHSFAGPPRGSGPTRVINDAADNLYGSTTGGGPADRGVLFRLDATGRETVLYSFTGGVDGGYPQGGVTRDSAGNLYGTTENGGTGGYGVVFKLDTTGHETVLYNFTGGADGGYPLAGVIRDSAGNIYGTTSGGGTSNMGSVFKLDTAGHESVLYSFTGGADGKSPQAGVTYDAAGNLYGTTLEGGTFNLGGVFKVDKTGHETVLWSFTGDADGGYPDAGVIRDAAGNLYGTTSAGGTSNWGVVFKLDSTGHLTVLYSFTGGPDGGIPDGDLFLDSSGNLYGTANVGGTSNWGVVFELDTSGHETVLYSFTGGADGKYPPAGVIRDTAGNLFGSAGGGPSNVGVVFKLDTTGHETVLCSFTANTGGTNPSAGLIRDSAGNLYGTTYVGGTSNWGVVFKLDTTGHETVLYSFTGEADGASPYGGLIQDSAGNLYGIALSGAGLVFELDTTGHETVLYNFTGGVDGASPYGGLIRDSAGNLYGTTNGGGTSNLGVVFKASPPATPGGTWTETALYSFTGGADGANPQAGVIRDASGNLYGATFSGGTSNLGVVFELDTAGHETVLYRFSGGADGAGPWARLTRDSAGNLYGTTLFGGTSGAGVVFRLSPPPTPGGTWTETVLYTFTGGADGASPYAGVVRDSAGNLYGTTVYGGKSNLGVVFKLDTAGVQTVLHSFTGGSDGDGPYAGLIRDSAGNLYGTTEYGGTKSDGIVFKLKP